MRVKKQAYNGKASVALFINDRTKKISEKL